MPQHRLALGHNLLTHLSDDLRSLSKLRYLNVRSNYFRDFPTVLCELGSLEILDISRNKIRTLPRQFGNLINLKVLSISKNRIETLPGYIAHMGELRILKIDHNPIVFPPPEVCAFDGGDEAMDDWLQNLKGFLMTNARQEADSAGSSTDDETDYATLSKTVDAKTVGRLRPAAPPIPSKNSHRSTASGHIANSKSVSAIRHFAASGGEAMEMERSRSNSGSDGMRRQARRAYHIHHRDGEPSVLENGHQRGFSHDYHSSGAEMSMRSPVEQQNSRAYFRRLSSLPQSKRISLSTARVIEASRGMLFSLSQIQQAVRQYVAFCTDPQLAGALNRVLYNANTHIGALVGVLEAHEAKPDGADATPVLEACRACVGAFRHAVKILHTRLSDITQQADIRYTRTLLLLLYGAAAEIQNSWTSLRSTAPALPAIVAATRSKSVSNASILSATSVATAGSTEDATDAQLFDKILQATTATLTLLSLLGDTISKSALASAQGPMTPGAVSAALNLKLRELAANALSAGEVTRRLKNKLANTDSLRPVLTAGGDMSAERKKFAEDTNLFVKAVINVAALAKSVSSEYPFSKAILSSLSAVTRSTKELTILFSVSSFQAARSDSIPSTAGSALVGSTASLNSNASSAVAGAGLGAVSTVGVGMPSGGSLAPSPNLGSAAVSGAGGAGNAAAQNMPPPSNVAPGLSLATPLTTALGPAQAVLTPVLPTMADPI